MLLAPWLLSHFEVRIWRFQGVSFSTSRASSAVCSIFATGMLSRHSAVTVNGLLHVRNGAPSSRQSVLNLPAVVRYDPIHAFKLRRQLSGTEYAASKVRPPRRMSQHRIEWPSLTEPWRMLCGVLVGTGCLHGRPGQRLSGMAPVGTQGEANATNGGRRY